MNGKGAGKPTLYHKEHKMMECFLSNATKKNIGWIQDKTVTANFFFDATLVIVYPNKREMMIWGLQEPTIKFRDGLSFVDPKDRDLFLETVEKKALYTVSPILTLTSGNKMQQFYKKHYHEEDYEYSSLLSIQGKTRLAA